MHSVSVRLVTPIAAERCIAARDLTEPRLSPDGTFVVYVVSEDGSAWLALHAFDGSPDRRLGEVPGVRSGRGMGGGAWCFAASADAVVLVGGDGNLWMQPVDGRPAEQLTVAGPDLGASSPCSSPDGRSIALTVDTAQVQVVDIATGISRRVDDTGDDFVLDPAWSPDGTCLEWVAWNVPDMPWDHTVVRRWDAHTGELTTVRTLAGLHQPRLLPSGVRLSIRDDAGWLNVYSDDQPVVSEPHEHAGPTWGPRQCSYAWSPDATRLAFTRNEGGFGRLCVVPLAGGSVQEVGRGVHGQLSWRGHHLAALHTGARTPTQVVVYDTSTWERDVVAVGPTGDWSDEELGEPERIEVPVEGGVVHARLYRAAANCGRMIVWLHGGPTDQWQVTWMPRIAFWRSRGWHVLVADHRGSTGHGRDYQQALHGRWGELDVADTVAVTRWAQHAGLAAADGTVVMGGSAGGFTALGAVAAAPRTYAAAVVSYPVTDLIDMAERSHRFERHYTDSLVGALPASADMMRARSPLWHTDQLVHTPLLVLHGEADPVVPVDQSRVLAERVRAAGGRVELHVYSGEGHGFRVRANQLDEYRRVEEFLSRHVRVASTM